MEIVDIQSFTTIVSTVGFPIACAVFMGWFILHIYNTWTQDNQKLVENLQAQSKEREDKLYDRLTENQRIVGEAVGTIAKYADRLETIQNDISEIKTDITVIMAKEK